MRYILLYRVHTYTRIDPISHASQTSRQSHQLPVGSFHMDNAQLRILPPLPMFGRRKAAPILLASSAPAPHSSRAKGLPFEGVLYDRLGLHNIFDLERRAFTVSVQKSVRSRVLSNLLDADLPAKVTLSGRVGTLGLDGGVFEPIAKVALGIRLLDLGAGAKGQGGFLRYKAAIRSNGRRGHGFEIDRKVAIANLHNTKLYGNVAYKTDDKSAGAWKTVSSFGIHQNCRLAGVPFATRIGMTPEGDFVYDIKL